MGRVILRMLVVIAPSAQSVWVTECTKDTRSTQIVLAFVFGLNTINKKISFFVSVVFHGVLRDPKKMRRRRIQYLTCYIVSINDP